MSIIYSIADISLALLRGVIWVFSIIKLVEMLRSTWWALRRGVPYRQRFLELVDEARENRTLDMERLRHLDCEHKLPRPLFFVIPRHLATRCSEQAAGGRLRHLGAVLRWLDFLPLLILGVALFLLRIPLRGLVWPEMILLLMLIFSQLLDLLVTRGILGFVDNFRRFFEINPMTYFREASYCWSKTTFTGAFLLGVIGFLGPSIVGFGGVFYGVYYLSCGEAFRNLVGRDMPVQLQLIYFSLVTMATVGYGDIQPASGWAQVAAGLEILFTMGFVVVFLFGLSLTITHEGMG